MSGHERQFPEPFEVINGVEYNTTPERALAKLTPEDRELWLDETRQMERQFEEWVAENERKRERQRNQT